MRRSHLFIAVDPSRNEACVNDLSGYNLRRGQEVLEIEDLK